MPKFEIYEHFKEKYDDVIPLEGELNKEKRNQLR